MGASRTATAVRRLCAADLDARELRARVLVELGRVLRFEGYAWMLTDPGTAVGGSPLADVGWLPQLPTHVRLKYATAVNRWTGLGTGEVATLHAATDGALDSSPLWRELLHGHGVGDVLSTVFRDRFGCWAFLELFRRAEDGPFTPAECGLLAELVPDLTQALRRAQARGFPSPAQPGEPFAGPVVLLLSPGLQVVGQTPDTTALLRALVPPPEGQPPVPAGVYNVGAQLLAVEAGVDAGPPTARVHVSGSRWVTLRAARLGDAEPDLIAVTLEASSPAERLDVFGRVFGLSAREAELLGHLASGLDTRALSALLLMSQHTVQDHLKSVFAKTQTRTRPGLLARALGT